jgi:hypothetical protein
VLPEEVERDLKQVLFLVLIIFLVLSLIAGGGVLRLF